ncbi:hypothetical protein J4231_01680 [Candidatus Woesearchaeota archaeon]|nr:hypothetical protein [Candidatus Woesearchaeota archaeon]
METQQDPSYMLNEIVNRLRSLESKQSLLTEKTLIINKNMIDEYRAFARHIKIMDSDLRELKLEVNRIKEVIREIGKETENYARKDSVRVLEKYINLIDPIKSIAESDVKRIVNEVINADRK